MKDYIIEISTTDEEKLEKVIAQLIMMGLKRDESFPPKKFNSVIKAPDDHHRLCSEGRFILKGKVGEGNLEKIEQSPGVINLWLNSGIIPFNNRKNI